VAPAEGGGGARRERGRRPAAPPDARLAGGGSAVQPAGCGVGVDRTEAGARRGTGEAAAHPGAESSAARGGVDAAQRHRPRVMTAAPRRQAGGRRVGARGRGVRTSRPRRRAGEAPLSGAAHGCCQRGPAGGGWQPPDDTTRCDWVRRQRTVGGCNRPPTRCGATGCVDSAP